MSIDNVDIETIGLTPAIIIVIVSVFIGILVQLYIIPGHGKIAFFSTMMILLSLISSKKIWKDGGVIAFLTIYILLHVLFLIVDIAHFKDLRSYLIAPIAIIDYTVFIFGVGFSFGKIHTP